MYIREEIHPQLKKLADTVHKHGTKLSGQIAYCGVFSRNKNIMRKVSTNFSRATDILKNTEFYAVEIHFGHGYLLSPLTNKRKDKYDGCIENRMRFPLQVLEYVRKEVGVDFPILGKITMYPPMKVGVSLKD